MKLTKQQKAALSRIENFPLIVDGDTYHLSNGESVHARTVECLINKGAIQPRNDGLFDGFTQTYVVTQ